MIGARYRDCTKDGLDLYNSSNSALAAYSHVDGNQRQSEGAARCSKSAANNIYDLDLYLDWYRLYMRYLYLDWYRCSIYISTGIDLLFISRLE